MPTTIYAVAQRTVTRYDAKNIALYNGLIDAGYGLSLPKELVDQLKESFGDIDQLIYKVPIASPSHGTIEVEIAGEGEEMYGEGMFIEAGNLPPNTHAIRIFAR